MNILLAGFFYFVKKISKMFDLSFFFLKFIA